MFVKKILLMSMLQHTIPKFAAVESLVLTSNRIRLIVFMAQSYHKTSKDNSNKVRSCYFLSFVIEDEFSGVAKTLDWDTQSLFMMYL